MKRLVLFICTQAPISLKYDSVYQIDCEETQKNILSFTLLLQEEDENVVPESDSDAYTFQIQDSPDTFKF